MNEIEKLIMSLKVLSKELENNSKIDTSVFYKNTIGRLSVATAHQDLIAILLEIRSSGAISQYANFTCKENALFDEVFNNTNLCLDLLETNQKT